MCRFTLYLGPPLRLSSLVTEPTNSLIHQSFQSKEREEPLNGDGFGVAWYVPAEDDRPAAFRSVSPAWSNRNLLELARVTRSGCVLAHVRAATQGVVVTETNCHPFCRGPFAFMHNGDIGGFHRIRRRLLERLSDEAFDAIEGTTDSEHLFALFLDCLRRGNSDTGVDRLAGGLRYALTEIAALAESLHVDEPSYLNVAVSDGRCAVASRFTTDAEGRADSLYVNAGRRYTCENGICRMIPASEGSDAVLISSEPLSQETGWESVPVNHLVLVDERHGVRIVPCNT